MLYNVLQRLSADTGFHIEQQRNALLALLNNAALEIYNLLECNKIYRECTLVVSKDAVVALPNIVGEVRGTRAHTVDEPFDLQSLGAPRYISGTWNYKVRNWRDLGETPVHTLVSSIGPLTITIPTLDASVTVLISGQTATSLKVQELVNMSVASKITTNAFGPAIFKIASFNARSQDITIKDTDGNEIAVLYNTDNQTRYKLIDVSQVFWSTDTLADESLIDIAYKLPLRQLKDDADSFPAGDDYDNAWYNMAMAHYYMPLENGANNVSMYRASSLAAIVSAKSGSEDQIVKKMDFGRGKFMDMFKGRSVRNPNAVNGNDYPLPSSASNYWP